MPHSPRDDGAEDRNTHAAAGCGDNHMITVKFRAALATLLASALLISPNVRAADDPNRTVGPQSDGTIVASSNQTLTPAGTIVDLGSPVVAKAVALNPRNKTAAVLLMAAA